MAWKFHSKPDYVPLAVDPVARHHCVICDAEGLERAEQFLAEINRSTTQNRSNELWVCQGEWAPRRNADARYVDDQTLGPALAAHIPSLRAGSRFYLIGHEGFILRTQALLREHGLPRASIRLERHGSPRRDLICMHCRHINRDVRQSPVTCGGCGRALLVYDHFSKRYGSYMGFQVNAECATEIPAPEELAP